ncbi:hypothetical protein HID58_014182 [Brassica napus]|uniref:Protein kinase domain-containing protein n=1 Tax=Brassica napus TaxID=3708 RepID=A0ABQ8DGG9_BRANA|nr:hypothetical protein HID58_014182 [Brassica napus]
MSYGSWFLDETPLPKLGFLGQGNNGYVTLVRNGDGLLMAKKTSFLKYSDDLEKEVRIMDRFFSINFNTVLEGLRDLHRDGYVHCDLKPENILIFPSYAHEDLCELKLGDFGSAKEPNGPDPVDGSLFEDNPAYLAPEAVRPRGVISSAVDIWSLGTMVMEMMGVTIRGRSDYVPRTLSQMTRDFVRRCRERNPGARATAEELMSHEFVRQSLGVPPLELLPVPSCLSNGVVQGRLF